jgi:hypothetical protein
MTVINSKEFITNEEKYFELALNEQVFIKKGENMFLFTCTDGHDETDIICKPDEDFYRSITLEEVQDRIVGYIRKKHANKK